MTFIIFKQPAATTALNIQDMKLTATLVFLFIASSIYAQQGNRKILSPEIQIKTATLPAPEEDRDAAMVYGYDDSGKLIILREGSNNLVCLADDPAKDGIQVSCYFRDLDPFMARGRALKEKGIETQKLRKIRGEEVESGSLKMPDVPSMQYILSGTEENYDKQTGELQDAYFRYVIYTPFATTESTGLPDRPHVPGMPWLRDPGKHRAHIMVTPVKD